MQSEKLHYRHATRCLLGIGVMILISCEANQPPRQQNTVPTGTWQGSQQNVGQAPQYNTWQGSQYNQPQRFTDTISGGSIADTMRQVDRVNHMSQEELEDEHARMGNVINRMQSDQSSRERAHVMSESISAAQEREADRKAKSIGGSFAEEQ